MSTDTEACPPPTHLTCASCGETKHRDDFYDHKGRSGGKGSYCKDCAKAKAAQQRLERPYYNGLQQAKKRAKMYGVPFALDEEYLEAIWTGTCPVFHTRLRLPGVGTKAQINQMDTPSLDRIRPELGYVPGNVIWISMYANLIKSHATHQEIRRVADWLEEIEKEILDHEAH